MGDDTEFIKLPLLQRCTHKLWKARLHGYTEAAKLFQEEDEKSPVFAQYVGLVPKFVSDSNAVAQEKGLEATLYFVQNASVAGKAVKDVMAGIVAKSIGAPKKSTQDLSMQIALMYIEVEKQESVVEELVKGLEHKNPKIVSACITVLTAGLRAFGSQVVGVKPLFKPIQTLIEDRDKTVRDETKNLVVEIYRWIGEAIKPQIAKLKPIQLTELETEFAKVKGEKAVPTRYLKSQQEKQAKAAEEGGQDGVDTGGTVVEAEIDPLSLIDPINILSKIPNNFYEQLESKKWQERKEALENLDKILDYPKFEKADYGDLVRALMKVINKDSNVVVVGIATKCIARLAAGLKKNFHPYASATLPQLLLKFKEKKANVVTPLKEAVDAVFLSTTLEAIQEDAIASLDNKNPSIKAETAAFLGRCFAQCTPTVLNKKLLKPYSAALLKTLNESDPSVRDSSAEALGVAMKVVGEKGLSPFLPDLDPLKLAKIKECCEKAVVKTVVVKAPAPESPKVEAKPKKVLSGGALKAQAVKEVVEAPVEVEEIVEEAPEQKKTGRVDISQKLTEELLANLSDKNWKTRNDALVAIQGMLTDTKIKSNLGELPPLLLLRFVDTNSKLAVTALEVCTALATAMGPGSKNHVRTFAKGIFNALGDSKQWVRSAAVTCLNTWTTEAGAKEFFGGEIIPDILKTGSPTLKIEVWTWLGEVLPNERGLPKEELHLMIPILFAALEDRNADVRKVANGAVMGMMMHLGYQNMAKEVDKLKPSSKAGIMQILDKIRPDVPDIEPKKAVKPKPEAKGKPAQPRASIAPKARTSIKPTAPVSRKKDEEIDLAPLLLVNKLKNQRVLDEQKLKILKWNFTTPRPEFVELLKDLMTTAGFNKNLMANMFHADFKFHLKAIESLSDDLGNDEALVSNLDLILKWLTLRFFDTNPSVLLKGLEYLQSAFGILIERDYTIFDVEANSFIPYLVMKIGDPKDAVRDRVRSILRQFSLMSAPGKLFGHIMDGLKSKNSRLRTECLEELGYLIEQFGTSVCMPSAPVALKEIAKQISDRDNSVRSAALNTIVKAYHVDGEKVLKQIGRLSDKDMSYLEERIKRSSQNRTKINETIKIPEKRQNVTMAVVPDPVEEYEEPEPELPVVEEPPPPPVHPAFIYKKVELPESRVPKIDLIEIDDKFLDEPVFIPESIRERLQRNPPPFPMLEEVVRNLGSENIQLAIEGSSKILAVLLEDKAEKLDRYSTMILNALVKQLGFANSYSVATHGSDLGKLYKMLFRIIEHIFIGKSKIGLNANENHLKGLLQLLLVALVEEKTIHFKEDGYNRWIVVFLIKILENSNTTKVTCAAISALHDLVEKPNSPRIIELTTKLILKLVVIFRNADDLQAILNLDQVLYTCHVFLQAFPRHTWKDRPSEMPLKCIKTLLTHLVELRGPDILSHMKSIENSISSELAMYLKKIILQQPNNSKPKLPKPLRDHLSEVFKKIGSEEKGHEGLVELYEFRKKHPDIDISAILEPTSENFKTYVKEGLKQIEMDRGPLKKVREVPPASPKVADLTVPIPPPNPPANDDLLAQYYADRLKLYQERLGMPVTKIDFKTGPLVD